MYFMIIGLLKFFFRQIIVSRMTSFFKFFSRTQYFINNHLNFSGNSKVQAAKTKSHVSESFKRQPSLSLRSGNIDDEVLCKEEVELVMETLGGFCQPIPGGDMLQERFGSADISNMFDEKAPCLDEVKGAFDVFDENRDGFIDAKELQRVLCSLGLKERSEIDDCRRMIQVFDENADGRIDFHEFVKFMESSFC